MLFMRQCRQQACERLHADVATRGERQQQEVLLRAAISGLILPDPGGSRGPLAASASRVSKEGKYRVLQDSFRWVLLSLSAKIEV